MIGDERSFIAVHDGLLEHPKVIGLSDKAFRHLIGMWCYCSRNRTDGRVPIAAWTERQGTSKKVRAELLPELVHEHGHTCKECPPVPQGYVYMHDYLKHQRSAAQIEQRQEKRREGGHWGSHKRWHANKGVTDPDCGYCTGELPPPKGPTKDEPKAPPIGQPIGNPEGNRWVPDGQSSEVRDQIPVETWEGGSPRQRAREQPPAPESLEGIGPRPADRCPKHAHATDPPPCRDCRDARHAAEQWDQARADRRALIAEAIDEARRDPRMRCKHDTDGGAFIHPDTGKSATCALCRRATEREAS